MPIAPTERMQAVGASLLGLDASSVREFFLCRYEGLTLVADGDDSSYQLRGPVSTGRTFYCPQCVDATGWRLSWHFPFTFACLDHGLLLRHDCDSCGAEWGPTRVRADMTAESMGDLVHCPPERPASGRPVCSRRLADNVAADLQPALRRVQEGLSDLLAKPASPAAPTMLRNAVRWAAVLCSDAPELAGVETRELSAKAFWHYSPRQPPSVHGRLLGEGLRLAGLTLEQLREDETVRRLSRVRLERRRTETAHTWAPWPDGGPDVLRLALRPRRADGGVGQ